MNLQPGELWPAIVRQTRHALGCGALFPIETSQATLEEAGVRFVVRQVSSLARKDEYRRARPITPAGGIAADPFLPCDPDLVVAEVSESHLAVLNKFNVIDHHLLIVTRSFEPQEALLNPADFEALLACMAQFDGLGFYNGGAAAGASQRHKHLQIVPFPSGERDTIFPFEPLLADAAQDNGMGTVPALPFVHAFARPAPWSAAPVQRAAQLAYERYRGLLDATGVRAIDVDGNAHQSAPYNLLVSTAGMLLIPRRAEQVNGISVNALGFAGALFVRDETQMRALRALGPMTALRRVAGRAST